MLDFRHGSTSQIDLNDFFSIVWCSKNHKCIGKFYSWGENKPKQTVFNVPVDLIEKDVEKYHVRTRSTRWSRIVQNLTFFSGKNERDGWLFLKSPFTPSVEKNPIFDQILILYIIDLITWIFYTEFNIFIDFSMRT